MTPQQVRVDGVDIAYTDTGSGPTILFVHGVYVTGAPWNDVVSELGDGGMEALRVLKRRLSDVVYRAMLTDQNQSLSAVA
jgi:pimeloyl-ACP methyl ester carboxylesterase